MITCKKGEILKHLINIIPISTPILAVSSKICIYLKRNSKRYKISGSTLHNLTHKVWILMEKLKITWALGCWFSISVFITRFAVINWLTPIKNFFFFLVLSLDFSLVAVKKILHWIFCPSVQLFCNGRPFVSKRLTEFIYFQLFFFTPPGPIDLWIGIIDPSFSALLRRPCLIQCSLIKNRSHKRPLFAGDFFDDAVEKIVFLDMFYFLGPKCKIEFHIYWH